MSYILDALRKAEAERGSGALPGLHSGGATPVFVDRRRLHTANPWLWIVAAGLALVALLVGAWLVGRQSAPGALTPSGDRQATASLDSPGAAPAKPRDVNYGDPSQAPALLKSAAAIQPVPATVAGRPTLGQAPGKTAGPASTAMDAPTAPKAPMAPITPAAPATTAVPAAPVRSASPAPSTPPAAATAAAVSATPSASAAPPAPAVAPTPAAPAAPAVAAAPSGFPAPDNRIHAIDDLPAEVRRELPSVSIGGLIQLDDPPRRSLIVNGAVYLEGEQIQPGLVLELIRSNNAVLKYRGHRFQVPI